MKSTTFILIALFSTTVLSAQNADRQVKVDTLIYDTKSCEGCPIVKDTIVYKLLKCGLYRSSKGDLAYRSAEIYNDNFDRRTRYLTWIYGAEPKDSLNGGLKEMKAVIDTASFQFLNETHWADKNHIYLLLPTSDGGSVSINKMMDRKTFKLFEGSDYAKDKNHIYYRGAEIEPVDYKTFKIANEDRSVASDKNGIYQFGERLTEDEIKDRKLEGYRK